MSTIDSDKSAGALGSSVSPFGKADGVASRPVEPSEHNERRNKFAFRAGMIVVILSLIGGFSTYLVLTGLTPIVPTHNVVLTMLAIDLVPVIAMICIITWQVMGLYQARKREAAAARLHVRIVSLFIFVAVTPAILLGVFAMIALDRGIENWMLRSQSLMEDSVDVALAYLREHGNNVRADVVGMAEALDESAALVKTAPEKFTQVMKSQAIRRGIPSVYLIDEVGVAKAHATRDPNEKYLTPPPGVLNRAKAGQVIIMTPGKVNKVRALVKLRNFRDTFLYVLRPVDSQVTRHLHKTRANILEYQRLRKKRSGIKYAFGLMYLAIALTILLAAIWLGLWFANMLVSPIRRLIGAAEQVSKGDLDVRLSVHRGEGDLGQLSSTFNDMTSELKNQRNDLMDANSMLDHRRRFMEAVLSGVTAGVIGLDPEGKINLANTSAEKLLGKSKLDLIDRPLSEVVPEFAALYDQAESEADKMLVQDHVNLFRDGSERNLAVRMTKERSGSVDHGLVVTFDDITELVSAQRTSAWADVARRIAHEIKNPLTPIQLSAERIRRRYGEKIGEDREVFDKCTETIIRQVGDIGRMVDEFSHFARMPKPVMDPADLGEIVQEAAFLFQMSNADINYSIEVPEEPVIMRFDRGLITQAVTNLVKNASEAISSKAAQLDGEREFEGRISVTLRVDKGRALIEVVDNGPGLPKKDRNRLIEPYMTTREKGTGLGLAIVQKITEQHGGTLRLEDAPAQNGVKEGACIRISLPITNVSVKNSPAETAETGGAHSADHASITTG